jgi:BirA family biotin operon repressor/biotin-[acetyl-CoA-carboxylase] ligase
MLDSRAIKKYLPKSLEVKLELLGSIASTNDYVKLHSKQYSWFCLAEHQSAGKGRFGRQWYSPFAANIYLTYSWLINKDVSELSGLSLVVSLAIVAALEAYGVENLSIKWPNDIYWQEQKLAGVLIEMIAESHGLTQVIIGIGLNANMPTVKDKNMKRSWTSLDQILNNYQDRNLIVAHLISHLCQSLQQFINAGLSSFTEQWQRYDYLQGKTITLSNSNQQISGKMRGINASGHLMLQVGNTLHTCSAGDTTLKT